MLRLLQVCNVGNIVGGTAACAWSVVRALPDWEHVVCFRSQPTLETLSEFRACKGVKQLVCHPRMSRREIISLQPDVVLLHNIGPGIVDLPADIGAVQFVHSRITPAVVDVEVNCSQWLSRERGQSIEQVCWQGVPRVAGERVKRVSDRLVVGRICTPTEKKWPAELIPFYEELASGAPHVDWEFVGCPEKLRPSLKRACQGRVQFHAANWQAREHLRKWDVLLYHHPTLTESFGRVVAEAMRAGTIPVVDNKGGFIEQVHSQVGFLCGHVTEFACALKYLEDHDALQQASVRASEWADSQFSFGAFRARLLRLFSRL
ncbi:MAG: glycosyltransferase [Planctomycetaceae bacterium]